MITFIRLMYGIKDSYFLLTAQYDEAAKLNK